MIAAPASLRDQAFDRIHGAIAGGTLVPGESLPDAELGTWLGMTRAPIRHALMRLADCGRVELAPGSLPRVSAVPAERVRSLVLVRSHYLAHAIAASSTELIEARLGALVRAGSALVTASRTTDLVGVSSVTSEIVGVFIAALANPVIARQVRRIDLELAGLDAYPYDLLERLGEGVRSAAEAGDRDAVVRAVAPLARP